MVLSHRLPHILSGLMTHAFFKTLEPDKPTTWAVLLILAPLILSIALGDSIAKGVTIHIATLLASVITWRLSTFHPLASYPGPVSARVSNIWMAWHTWQGRRHHLVHALHKQYGTHVRIGPNAVSIVDVNAVKDCLSSHGMPRSLIYRATEPDGMPPNLLSVKAVNVEGGNPEKRHNEKRRVWAQGFTTQALRDYDVYILARTRQLVERLTEVGQTGVVDLRGWFDFLTFDVMGDLIFGGGFSMLKDGADLSRFLEISHNILPALAILPWFPWLHNLLPYAPGMDAVAKHRAFADACIAKRREEPDQKDLFHWLAQEDSETPTEHHELVNDLFLATGAAAETTAGVLSALFYELALHKDVMQKLRAEIDENFAPHEEPTDAKTLVGMRYLNACIDEVLRFNPQVPMQIARTPSSGCDGALVSGKFVPEGTSIWLPPYPLMRDPRYFSPSPNAFWPERWLPETKKSHPDLVLNREAFIPFSYGPGNCVGKHVAMRQLRVVTASVIHKLDFVFADGYEARPWGDCAIDWVVMAGGQVPVRLTPRYNN